MRQHLRIQPARMTRWDHAQHDLGIIQRRRQVGHDLDVIRHAQAGKVHVVFAGGAQALRQIGLIHPQAEALKPRGKYDRQGRAPASATDDGQRHLLPRKWLSCAASVLQENAGSVPARSRSQFAR